MNPWEFIVGSLGWMLLASLWAAFLLVLVAIFVGVIQTLTKNRKGNHRDPKRFEADPENSDDA